MYKIQRFGFGDRKWISSLKDLSFPLNAEGALLNGFTGYMWAAEQQGWLETIILQDVPLLSASFSRFSFFSKQPFHLSEAKAGTTEDGDRTSQEGLPHPTAALQASWSWSWGAVSRGVSITGWEVWALRWERLCTCAHESGNADHILLLSDREEWILGQWEGVPSISICKLWTRKPGFKSLLPSFLLLF